MWAGPSVHQNLRPISEKENIPFLFILGSLPCNGGAGSETAEARPPSRKPMQVWGKWREEEMGKPQKQGRGRGHQERPRTTIFPGHLAQESQAETGQRAGSRESSDKVKEFFTFSPAPPRVSPSLLLRRCLH